MYGKAVSVLTPDAKRALLIAAMLDDSPVAVVDRALGFAGLSIAALEPAEEAGLVRFANGFAKMRHPLARSAVIQLAPANARRAAHLACADGLLASPAGRCRVWVWHLADASVGADESIAEILEDQAGAAMARTGYAAACLIYQRAANLSEGGPARTRRLLAAAEAGLAAGLPSESQKLLRLLEHEVSRSADQRAATAHLSGRLRSAAGDPPGAAGELQREAERIRHTNPALAAQISADAAFSAVLAGQMSRAGEAADLVSNIGLDLGPGVVALGDLLVGVVQAMSGAGDDARDRLDRCRPAIDVPDPSVELLHHMVYLATAYVLINSFSDALPILDRAIAIARQREAIGVLPFALAMSATTRYRIGEWEEGYAHATEAVTLADDIGQAHIRPNAMVMIAQIDAARGNEQARVDAFTVIREASAMGATFLEAQGLSMLGLARTQHRQSRGRNRTVGVLRTAVPAIRHVRAGPPSVGGRTRRGKGEVRRESQHSRHSGRHASGGSPGGHHPQPGTSCPLRRHGGSRRQLGGSFSPGVGTARRLQCPPIRTRPDPAMFW